MTKKNLVISVILFFVSLNMTSQVLDKKIIQNTVLTIENYLNNKPYNSYFCILSVNKWNPDFHNGYSQESNKYLLNTIGYPLVSSIKTSTTDNIITISISQNKDDIIIVIYYNNKYFGFNQKLILENNSYRIECIPDVLYEID